MFVKEIMTRMESLTAKNYRDVQNDAKVDTVVIGEMSELHRKLYALSFQYKDEVRHLKSTMMQMQAKIINDEENEKKAAERTEKECHSMNLAANISRMKADAVFNILWVEIHGDFESVIPPEAVEFALLTGNKIGYSVRRENTIPNFLRGLLGE